MNISDQKIVVESFLDKVIRVQQHSRLVANDNLRCLMVYMRPPPQYAYYICADSYQELFSNLPDLELLQKSGLNINIAARTPKLGDLLLFIHHDINSQPVNILTRRYKPGRADPIEECSLQYHNNQITRIPFGLPSLYHPDWFPWRPDNERAHELIIVADPIDAMAANRLGWPALATSMRPGPEDFTNGGAVPHMLNPHIAYMQKRECIYVIKDTPINCPTAHAPMAHRMAEWLCSLGCRAQAVFPATLNHEIWNGKSKAMFGVISRMSDLCALLPPPPQHAFP